MKQLRQYIRQVLLEIRDLSPEEEELAISAEKRRNFGRRLPDKNAKDLRRAVGLQSREEQIADRTFLQTYQADLEKSSEGKKMIDAFMNGSVTVLHSMTYRGLSAGLGMGGSDDLEMFSDWIKKYGKSGDDTLSTVAFPVAPSQSLPGKLLNKDNARDVSESRGMILKGYPVYVSDRDVYSQTLGAASPALKKHQAQSGIAKRASNDPSDIGPIYSLKQMRAIGGAQEVLLDNWDVIGTYISRHEYTNEHTIKYIREFIEDSLNLGLPCNIYLKGDLLARIKNKKDYDGWKDSKEESS